MEYVEYSLWPLGQSKKYDTYAIYCHKPNTSPNQTKLNKSKGGPSFTNIDRKYLFPASLATVSGPVFAFGLFVSHDRAPSKNEKPYVPPLTTFGFIA